MIGFGFTYVISETVSGTIRYMEENNEMLISRPVGSEYENIDNFLNHIQDISNEEMLMITSMGELINEIRNQKERDSAPKEIVHRRRGAVRNRLGRMRPVLSPQIGIWPDNGMSDDVMEVYDGEESPMEYDDGIIEEEEETSDISDNSYKIDSDDPFFDELIGRWKDTPEDTEN